MSTVPKDGVSTMLVRLDVLADQLRQIAAQDPGRLVHDPELTAVVQVLSEAAALFHSHRVIAAAPTMPSLPQPAGDLLLAAELLHGALTGTSR